MGIIKINKKIITELTHITLHWSAGTWFNAFHDYHICIGSNEQGTKAVLMPTLPIEQIGKHTWNRNLGNIGVCVLGMAGAIELNAKTGKHMINSIRKEVAYINNNTVFSFSGGTYFPITITQIEMMAKVVAELCLRCNIQINNIKDHAYYANLDQYPSKDYRWDIKPFFEDIMRKVNWYIMKLKTYFIKYEYTRFI